MTEESYRFRDFVLIPSRRELWQSNRLQTLPASAFDALVYLVRHRERAIGRDELIAAVWGRVDVADTLLAQTILRLRRLLGERGSDGAIRTVARFGYHWVEPTWIGDDRESPASQQASPATEVDPATAVPTHEPVHRPPLPRRRRTGRLVSIATGLMLLLGAGAWWWSRPVPVVSETIGRDQAVAAQTTVTAVLPAQVPDLVDWAWLRLGLMDMVANRLRQGGLAVAASESVLAMLAGDETVQATDPMQALPGIGRTVQARVERLEHGVWLVHLHLAGAGQEHRVESSGEDALTAAHAAADLLLIRLGRTPPERAAAGLEPIDERLQRVRAAVLADRLELAEELIETAPPELDGHAEFELQRARIEQARGRYGPAQRRLQALLLQLPEASDTILRGRVLSALGAIAFRRRQIEQAEQAFAAAIELLGDGTDPIALGEAYMGRAAVAATDDSRLDEAAADLGRARIELEAAGQSLGVAQIDLNLGMVQVKRYRPDTALPLLQRAQEQFERLGAREPLAYSRYVTVSAQLQLLDLEAALVSSAPFWPPADQTENERLRWRLALVRGFALVANGRLGEADAVLARIAADADAADDASVLAGGRTLQALIEIGRGQHEAAVERLNRELTPRLAELRPDLYVSARSAHLRALRHLGRLGEAAEHGRHFAGWVAGNGNPWRHLQLALAQAEQAWAERPDDEALAGFAQAFEQAVALAIPDDLVHVAEPYTIALIERGQLDQASSVVGRIAAWADRDLRAAWAQAELFRAQGRTSAWQRSQQRVESLRGERVLNAPSRAP